LLVCDECVAHLAAVMDRTLLDELHEEADHASPS
jgi:hypothetical protein